MRRLFAARCAEWLLCLCGSWLAMVGLAPAAAGQGAVSQWNDPRSRALVELATHRRAEQFADTGLVDYQATAHGYLAFLAQVGEGFPDPPKIVRTDELAVEVYWHAPNQSKQVVVGRRDTLLLPTDIQYYRDRFGIYQNNLPNLIRMGDGQDVRDVPHPLSPAGLQLYDFAITDSLLIRTPGRDIHVIEVAVRPKDDKQARVIGALYIDPSEGQVVRMALNFTHAAFLDHRLEDVAIVLENQLVGTRYWLPSRQEIEVRRTGTWLDFPVRGIIRGRWQISDYTFNVDFSRTLFTGPEIVQASAAEQASYPWKGLVLDSLPADVGEVMDPDIRHVEEQARAIVRAQALARVQRLTVSAPAISQFARVDRVEGLAPGFGIGHGLGSGFTATARGRYGIDDHAFKGTGTLYWEMPPAVGVSLFAEQDFRDTGDQQERSTIVNSLAAQELGSDDTDPYGIRRYGVAATFRTTGGLTVTAEGANETEQQLSVHAVPASGHYDPTLTIVPLKGTRFVLRGERPVSAVGAGWDLAYSSELRALIPHDAIANSLSIGADARWSTLAEASHPIGDALLVSRTSVAVARSLSSTNDAVPAQEMVMLGGPSSMPGYGFHQIVGTNAESERLELQVPIPFLSLSLGRFGRTPSRATLAPFFSVASSGNSNRCLGGWGGGAAPINVNGIICSPERANYSAVGLGLIGLYGLVRFDVAKGIGNGGEWTFNVDVTRTFWKIL